MTLSEISIKNSVFAWMLFFGIVLFGLISFFNIGISQFPDVDFPVISISTTWEGAAPEVMEMEVSDVIESAITGIQGVKEIVSTSRQGISNITVEFELNKNIDVALQEIQSNISRAQRLLPNDIDPPIIRKSNPEDRPILWLSVSGDRDIKFLMEYTRDFLKDQFSTVPGVGEVSLGGFSEPSLRVWLDADLMQRYELTVEDVLESIQSEHFELPAGYIDTQEQEFNVRVAGETKTIDEFGSIIIQKRRGSPVWRQFKIKDIGFVEDGLENIRQISRSMGKPSVGLAISKQRNINAVAVARAVKKRLKEIQPYLPKGLNITLRFDTTKFVEDSINEMNFIILLSVVLTAIICWLFLGSINSAFNIFLTIPMSIFGSFFAIYIMGFTLNIFTLLGLSLVIGIVVDDAIMVLENIARHIEAGESSLKASIIGSKEITFAAVAATLAILAIFIPVIFMKGIIGRYFFQFGVTISVAVMISLLGALTLTPMYSSKFLSIGHTTLIGKFMEGLMNKIKIIYTDILILCLKNRWKVIFVAFLIFSFSLFIFKGINKEFIPPQDQGVFSIRIQTKIGSSLWVTSKVVEEVEKVLLSKPEISNYFSRIGGDETNSANIFVTLKPRKERPIQNLKRRPLTQQEFMYVLSKELKSIPGVQRVIMQDPSQSGFTARRSFPVEFTLSGPEWDMLVSLSEKMMNLLEKSGYVSDIDTDFRVGMPEVQIIPDRKRSAERGVSIASIAKTINALIGGVKAGKYTKGSRRYDIRVQLLSKDRKNPQDINKIWVRNNYGELIKLSDVVEIKMKPTLLSITRKNRERAIRIFANVIKGRSQDEALRRVEEIAKDILPDGYRIVFSGSAQIYKESFKSLYFVLILGIVVAYMILGTQFNSFIHPLTVLLALPFSISGALLSLKISNQTLNIFSMIGIILLMGIVKKNSILLVDFTNQKISQGLRVDDALLNACPLRLRPILMTSTATIAAAIPPALAIGPGAETRIPMAVVIIGGVLFSTLLTLFVVPCAYSLLSSIELSKNQNF